MNSMQKLLTTLVIALAITIAQAGPVAAQSGTPVLPWTINTITPQIDPVTGDVTGVVVELTDDMGNPQTVNLTQQEALDLGLINPDGTVNSAMLDTMIDPTLLPSSGTGTEEEPQHPVGSKLSDFFSELLGVDYDAIMQAHEDGMGFGVIAQALWMTKKLAGDASTFQAILYAKQNHDYSGITLPDGSTPTNW